MLLPHRPVGRRMCIGGGPPRAHRVQVFPHELEGHGGPCFSAGPLPAQFHCPSMSGLSPKSVSLQRRWWEGQMKRRVQSVQEMTFGGAAFGTGFPHMLALSKPTMSGEAGLAVVFPDSKEPMPMWWLSSASVHAVSCRCGRKLKAHTHPSVCTHQCLFRPHGNTRVSAHMGVKAQPP